MGPPHLTAAPLAVVALAACASSEPSPATGTGRVALVADGDTLRLVDGRRIRLVQVDAPEAGRECWGGRARQALATLAPAGSEIELERDPELDDRDRFGRLLRYVRRDGRLLNVALVERGAAAPYFFRGERGRYADDLLAAARTARAARRGLWRACPAARLRPERALATGRAG